MPTLPRLANNDLVCIAWLGSIPGLSTSMVATQLPADDTAWAATGFITATVVGGSPNIYLPIKKPVFQIDCYAVKPGSNKPPFFKANVLAETIRYATLQRTGFNRLLSLTAGNASYPPARVQNACLLTEPRRRFGDLGDYAVYGFDLALEWITATDIIP